MVVLLLGGGGLAGVAVGLAQGAAPPGAADFTAVDNAWNATGSSPTAHAVTIAAGGTVTFSYPTGMSTHNVDFAGGPSPTACTQDGGPTSGAVPPLPHAVTAAGWSGTCTFTTPGTYTFHCDLHASMVGTIDVVAPGDPGPTTTTTTTTTATTTTGPAAPPSPATPTTTTTTGASAPPTATAPVSGAAPKRLALTATRRQRGTSVRGTATLAQRGTIAATLRAGATTLGRLGPRTVAAGAHRLTVPLGAAARRSLRRHGHLTAKLTVTLTGAGATTRASATVTLTAGG
jgi:plastocyanin